MFRGLPWARDLIHDLSNLHNVLAKEALLAHVTDWETEVKRKMTCSRSQSTSVVKPRCESRLPVLGLSLFLPPGLAILCPLFRLPVPRSQARPEAGPWHSGSRACADIPWPVVLSHRPQVSCCLHARTPPNRRGRPAQPCSLSTGPRAGLPFLSLSSGLSNPRNTGDLPALSPKRRGEVPVSAPDDLHSLLKVVFGVWNPRF